MKRIGSVCVFLAGTLILAQESKDLLNLVTPCKRNDPNSSNCWKTAVENLRPHFGQEIQQLKLPSLDPLRIPSLPVFGKGSNRLISYSGTFSNIVYSGAKDLQVVTSHFEIDSGNVSVKFELFVPKIHAEIDAVVAGSVLGYAVDHDGISPTDIWNATIILTATGKTYSQNDSTYVKWDQCDVDISYDKAILSPRGFFIDPIVDKLFTTTIKQNTNAFYPDIIAVMKNTIGSVAIEAMNRIHEAYPLEILYPES